MSGGKKLAEEVDPDKQRGIVVCTGVCVGGGHALGGGGQSGGWGTGGLGVEEWRDPPSGLKDRHVLYIYIYTTRLLHDLFIIYFTHTECCMLCLLYILCTPRCCMLCLLLFYSH